MKKMERIRAALSTLKADAPDLWAEAIENGVCPHNAGMHSAHLYGCGYNETEKADGGKSPASDDRESDALLTELAEANNTARRFAAEELRQLQAFSFLRMGLRVVGAVLAVCAAAKFCHLLFEQALENVVFQHVFF